VTAKQRRTKGTGGVRNRGTERAPRWQAYYSVTIDGKRRQITEGPFRRKADAEAWLREELVAGDRGEARVPTTITVAEALREWLEHRRHELAPNTFAEYERDVTQRIIPHLGHRRLRDLTGAHIGRLYAKLREPGADRRARPEEPRGLSEASIHHTAGTLHAALQWCVTKRRWITRNPVNDAPRVKPERVEMRVWKPDQLAAFLRAAEADRLWPIFRLAATTGMRRGELLGLRWGEVNLDHAKLMVARRRVRSGTQMVDALGAKTKRGERTIDLDAATVAAIRRWRTRQLEERMAAGEAWMGPEDTAALHVATDELGAPMPASRLESRYASVLRRAEVPVIRWHDLRHTHATLLLNAGRPVHEVARRLGHTAEMCLSTYAHVLDQQGAEGAAAFAALID
jgi:integrase